VLRVHRFGVERLASSENRPSAQKGTAVAAGGSHG
jgi:hypothetical protein